MPTSRYEFSFVFFFFRVLKYLEHHYSFVSMALFCFVFSVCLTFFSHIFSPLLSTFVSFFAHRHFSLLLPHSFPTSTTLSLLPSHSSHPPPSHLPPPPLHFSHYVSCTFFLVLYPFPLPVPSRLQPLSSYPSPVTFIPALSSSTFCILSSYFLLFHALSASHSPPHYLHPPLILLRPVTSLSFALVTLPLPPPSSYIPFSHISTSLLLLKYLHITELQ